MRATTVKLLLICLLSLGFRLALLGLVQNPGISDPAHYYNLGRRLHNGEGFTIDYVWHYGRMPVEIAHATDHWMPLPGLAVAIGMRFGGVNIQAALALFVLAGSLTPMLAFAATKQLSPTDACALAAAALAAFLPEFTLNSLRADTTILNVLFVGAGFLCAQESAKTGRVRTALLGGIAFGLAHLTRNDSIILIGLYTLYLLAAEALGKPRMPRKNLALFLLAVALTIAPWHIRNLQEIGSLGSPQMSRMPFMVEPRDLYAYGIPITLESLLERQSLGQLLGKRVFEFAAACKQMGVALQLPMVALTPIGLVLLIVRKRQAQLNQLLPVLIWLAAILFIYPVLMPVHNQGGSFKKLFITIIPLLMPLGALALHKLVRRAAWRNAILLVSLAWLFWSSYDLVRRETALADRYYASMQILLERLETLPDRTGDSELRLMAQDPYILSALGYSSVVTPLASREDTLYLARQFDIDYLLMPAARPALDPLFLGSESDPRFQLAARVDDAGETPFELYGFAHSKADPP